MEWLIFMWMTNPDKAPIPPPDNKSMAIAFGITAVLSVAVFGIMWYYK